MGTDLYPIANHQIWFEGKTLDEIIAEIQLKLDNLVLNNHAFLLDYALYWNNDNPERCLQIQNTSSWYHAVDDMKGYDFNSAEDKVINFSGPCDLQITFFKHTLLMMNPFYRYTQWLGLRNEDGTDAIEIRNEWRKYFRQMATTFGGNRLIYFADNSHPLSGYWGGNERLEEIEQALKKRFGASKVNFKETLEEEQNSYLVDRFNDLF
jgi:hypothetical protein